MLYQDIRLGCKLYHQNTAYDRDYNTYFKEKNQIKWDDPRKIDQIEICSLIKFLKCWGCRKATSISTSDLESVLQEVVSLLKSLESKTVLTIYDEDFGVIKKAYDRLWTVKNVGPTTASKILHTINPALFVMWDEDIRNSFEALRLIMQHARAEGYGVTGDEGIRAVSEVMNDTPDQDIRDRYATGFMPLMQGFAEFSIMELNDDKSDSRCRAIQSLKSCSHEKALDTGSSSVAKILDEYNFMKYTKKHPQLWTN